jgi:hypothetical protein
LNGQLAVGAVVLWIVPIFVACSQGRAKNRSGIWYGLLLGWLGVIVLALLPALPSGEYGECPGARRTFASMRWCARIAVAT